MFCVVRRSVATRPTSGMVCRVPPCAAWACAQGGRLKQALLARLSSALLRIAKKLAPVWSWLVCIELTRTVEAKSIASNVLQQSEEGMRARQEMVNQ
jgi:hypothetical protein